MITVEYRDDTTDVVVSTDRDGAEVLKNILQSLLDAGVYDHEHVWDDDGFVQQHLAFSDEFKPGQSLTFYFLPDGKMPERPQE